MAINTIIHYIIQILRTDQVFRGFSASIILYGSALCKNSISCLVSVVLFPSVSAIFSTFFFMEGDNTFAHGAVATPDCKIARWNNPKKKIIIICEKLYNKYINYFGPWVNGEIVK